MTYPPPPTTCRVAHCGFPATGRETGKDPHPDDDLCRTHRVEFERRRYDVPPSAPYKAPRHHDVVLR